jgi:hypothetical protein
MSVTVPTKDVGETRVKRCCGKYIKTDEDRIEEYIKKELRINE